MAISHYACPFVLTVGQGFEHFQFREFDWQVPVPIATSQLVDQIKIILQLLSRFLLLYFLFGMPPMR